MSRATRVNLLLLAAVVVIAMLPLVLPLPAGVTEPFAGADGQAEAAILAANPDYQPWAKPLWEPPSGEIESLLFALQAALGAGLLGYYLGLRRGQARRPDSAGQGADGPRSGQPGPGQPEPGQKPDAGA